MKRRLGNPDFGMLDVFKITIEPYKEILQELDYYERMEKCFEENSIAPFVELDNILEEFLDFEYEEYEELGNYLLKTLYTYWNAEMAMYRRVLYLELLHHASENEKTLEKYLNVMDLKYSIKENDCEQKEMFEYLDSQHLYIEDIPHNDYDIIEKFYTMVKTAKIYKDLINMNTGYLLDMSDYFKRD